jgi:hypothetical protein
MPSWHRDGQLYLSHHSERSLNVGCMVHGVRAQHTGTNTTALTFSAITPTMASHSEPMTTNVVSVIEL